MHSYDGFFVVGLDMILNKQSRIGEKRRFNAHVTSVVATWVVVVDGLASVSVFDAITAGWSFVMGIDTGTFPS